MGFIAWLVMGALVGWVASMLMGTNAQQGTFLNIVVGIVGASLGGMVSRALGGSGATINNSGINVTSFSISLIGAVLLLGLLRVLRG
ncbi:MAG: GlsB/YeaQ/YmgE family stress response membrane protein [Myxococcales bacterium]|nr:GlsB/YeaQ/YmgE family stress response membrane protein [Myxococcales bacterium]